MENKITFEKDTKLFKVFSKLRRYCKHCGHSIVFFQNSRRDKVVCQYCGNYIYKDDLTEFKEKIKKCQK